jgi:hypothetical protein
LPYNAQLQYVLLKKKRCFKTFLRARVKERHKRKAISTITRHLEPIATSSFRPQPNKHTQTPATMDIQRASNFIKVNLAGDLRRITFDGKPDFECVSSRLEAVFPSLVGNEVTISYIDDEGDQITVATDADLSEAFAVTQWPRGRPSLQLGVTVQRIEGKSEQVADRTKECKRLAADSDMKSAAVQELKTATERASKARNNKELARFSAKIAHFEQKGATFREQREQLLVQKEKITRDHEELMAAKTTAHVEEMATLATIGRKINERLTGNQQALKKAKAEREDYCEQILATEEGLSIGSTPISAPTTTAPALTSTAPTPTTTTPAPATTATALATTGPATTAPFAEYGGVDPSVDPELADALRVSIEEHNEEHNTREAASAKEPCAGVLTKEALYAFYEIHNPSGLADKSINVEWLFGTKTTEQIVDICQCRYGSAPDMQHSSCVTSCKKQWKQQRKQALREWNRGIREVIDRHIHGTTTPVTASFRAALPMHALSRAVPANEMMHEIRGMKAAKSASGGGGAGGGQDDGGGSASGSGSGSASECVRGARGREIVSIADGTSWGEVIADEGNVWRLASGRIAKKRTEGSKWRWCMPRCDDSGALRPFIAPTLQASESVDCAGDEVMAAQWHAAYVQERADVAFAKTFAAQSGAEGSDDVDGETLYVSCSRSGCRRPCTRVGGDRMYEHCSHKCAVSVMDGGTGSQWPEPLHNGLNPAPISQPGGAMRTLSEPLPFFAQFREDMAGQLNNQTRNCGAEQQKEEAPPRAASGAVGASTFFLDDMLGTSRDTERQQIEGTLLSFLN